MRNTIHASRETECKRERERESERDKERERESCVHALVCVCVVGCKRHSAVCSAMKLCCIGFLKPFLNELSLSSEGSNWLRVENWWALIENPRFSPKMGNMRRLCCLCKVAQ